MDKVFCKICRMSVAYLGNTTNMTYHLHKQHPVVLENCEGEKERASREVGKQLCIQQAFARSMRYISESTKQKQLVNAMCDFICKALMWVSEVDEQSFRKLLEIADRRFELPHRIHFSRKVIPEHYCLTCLRVEKELSDTTAFLFTSDLWTAQHQIRAYISLMVHFISNFKLILWSLQTLEMSEDHTAESLSEVLCMMLKCLNAWNIVNAVGNMGVFHFPFMGHTLQLAVNKGSDVARINRCISDYKSIVTHLKKEY